MIARPSLVVPFTMLSLMTMAIVESADDTPSSPSPTSVDIVSAPISDHRFFLHEIFTKYGHNGKMTLEGFEHLLENLKLGNIIIQDHDLMSHKEESAFLNMHDTHEHQKIPESSVAKAAPNRGERDSEAFRSLPLPNHRNLGRSQTQSHLHRGHGSHPHHAHKHDTSGSQHEAPEDSDPQHDSHGRDGSHQHQQSPEHLNDLKKIVDGHDEGQKQQQLNRTTKQCLTPLEILATFEINPTHSLSPITFLHLCPAIIYELDQQHCYETHSHGEEKTSISLNQWLYSSLAVLVISLCGLFSVAVIPIMQKRFYHTLLQFLVGLAVGTLTGDAMLHLLPHAMLANESGDHEHHGPDVTREVDAVWRGITALGGIYLFFIAERLLKALNVYRRQKREKAFNLSDHEVQHHDQDDLDVNSTVGEKLSHYRKNSYGLKTGSDGKENIQMLQNQEDKSSHMGSRQSSVHEVTFHGRSSFSADPVSGALYLPAAGSDPNSDQYVVTVSEHHGHSHGHSHEVPQSVSAVALMVIMGDGLHNFCDGMAIGAAFASEIGGGISTTVAVFCHELPHELGDFAMLLKTGMAVRQALLYNCLSSVLCLIGMVIGVSLGSMQSATSWIFAGTAGMFLYIALVDMLPELDTPNNDPSSTPTYTLAVQVLGISIGVSVMLLIAIFERDLKNIAS